MCGSEYCTPRRGLSVAYRSALRLARIDSMPPPQCFNIYIYNRQGVCIHYQEWYRPKTVQQGTGSQVNMMLFAWCMHTPGNRPDLLYTCMHARPAPQPALKSKGPVLLLVISFHACSFHSLHACPTIQVDDQKQMFGLFWTLSNFCATLNPRE